MALGNTLVAKLGAVVTYVKARVDIKLDYDSKNVILTGLDSITASDIASTVVAYIRGYTDSVTASSVVAVVMAHIRTYTDSVTASIVVAVAVAYIRGYTDSVTASSVVAVVMGYIRGYTDSVTITGSHTSAIGKNIPSVDSVTPGDAIALGINVNIYGVVTADDALLTYWGGMFAGSMFNDHMYAEDVEGAVGVRMDDVIIVIT